MRARWATLVLGSALTACGVSSPGASVVPSSVSTAPLAAPSCEGISLRAPDGTVILLSGRWIGSGDPNALPNPSVFDIRQNNDCLVWVGRSAAPGESIGETWIETFSGNVHDEDFTIRGSWYDVTGRGFGSVTVGIDFIETADGYEVELRQLASTGDIHQTKHWVRQEPTQ